MCVAALVAAMDQKVASASQVSHAPHPGAGLDHQEEAGRARRTGEGCRAALQRCGGCLVERLDIGGGAQPIPFQRHGAGTAVWTRMPLPTQHRAMATIRTHDARRVVMSYGPIVSAQC